MSTTETLTATTNQGANMKLNAPNTQADIAHRGSWMPLEAPRSHVLIEVHCPEHDGQFFVSCEECAS